MKRIRPFLVLLLACALVLGWVPLLCATAAEEEITRARWLQQLVNTFGYTVEEELLPDRYYPDLDTDADYYQDVLVAIYYGLVDVPVNTPLEPDSPATRAFAAHSLNLCMGYLPEQEPDFAGDPGMVRAEDLQVALERGWFERTGDGVSPDAPITAAEQERMLEDARAYAAFFAMGDGAESTYTFQDGIIEITDPVTIESGTDSSLIIIRDYAGTIQNGDRFVVYSGGLALPWQAQSVETSDGETRITASALAFDQAIASMEARATQITDPGNFYTAEDAQLIFIEESTGAEYSQAAAVRARASGSASVFVPKYTKTIDLGGGFKVKMSVELQNAFVGYDVKLKGADLAASVWLESDVEVSGKASCELSDLMGDGFEVYIGGYEVPGVGGLRIVLKFSASGSIVIVQRHHMRFGIQVSKNAFQWRPTMSRIFSLTDYGSCVNSEITARIGLEAKFGLYGSAMPLAGYIYAEGGFEANVVYTTYNDIPGSCTDFAAYLFAEYGARVECSVLGIEDELSWEPINADNSPVKLRFHYEDGIRTGGCSREGHAGTTTGDPTALVSNGYLTGYDSSYIGSGLCSGFGSQLWGPGGDPIVLYTYTLDENDQATITGYNGLAASLVIPQQIDGYDVIAIGDYAFQGRSDIQTLIMHDGILYVGGNAFQGCANLRNVEFSETLTWIGHSAFRDCQSLTMAILPDTLEEISCGAFMGCTALQRLYFPANAMPQDYNAENYMYPGPFSGCSALKYVEFGAGITRIPYGLFDGCTGLREITIPDTVTEIQHKAFQNCTGLETVILPEGLVTIGHSAFSGCTALVEVTLPLTLEHLNNNAFGGCTALPRINIPKITQTEAYTSENYMHPGPFSGCSSLAQIEFEEGITRIPKGMFYNCTGLTELTIPDTVTSIDFRAFRFCSNLETVHFPDTLTTIHQGAFRNCTSLKEVILPDNLLELAICAFGECEALTKVHIPRSFVVRWEFDTLGNWNTGVFGHCPNLTEVTWAEGITTVPNRLFWNCTGLTEITLPDTVLLVERSAFNTCSNLTTVTFPETLTGIGVYAFLGCGSLTGLELPDALTDLGYDAFADCTSLTSVHIPDQVTVNALGEEINDVLGVFSGCLNLTEVTIEEGMETLPCYLLAGMPALEQVELPQSLTRIFHRAFQNCTALKSIRLPESLTHIDAYAFHGCVSLTELTIPALVTNLNYNSFSGCTALEKVTVLGALASIPSYCFDGCTALKEIDIADGLASIGYNAFRDCSSLTGFRIPETVTLIEQDAFKNCDALTAITIPDSVKKLEQGVFYDCDALETVVMADSVTQMGVGTFHQCDALNNVTLSNNLTRIPTRAFQECPALEEIRIPARVTDIDSDAFRSSVNLKKVILPRGVESISTSAFSYPGTTVLYGVAGTYAETWAQEHGYQFVAYSSPAESVTLPETAELYQYDSLTLLPVITPADFTDAILWKSSDPDIVSVDENGTLYGRSPGTATIKITVGSVTASCTVTVRQKVSSIELNCWALTLLPGQSSQLTATIWPQELDSEPLLWYTEDETIATVDETGLVTAVSEGTAQVWVETPSLPGYKFACTVTVLSSDHMVTDPAKLESDHNYPDNFDDFWIYTAEGALSLAVTFDGRTMLEENFDYLYLYYLEGGAYVLFGEYTGAQLSGVTLEIPGDSLKLRLVSDASGNEWGFRVSDIVPEYPHTHAYTAEVTAPTCTEGGYTTYTCECGDTYTGDGTPALGHTYEDGTCTRCGGEDPDYEKPTEPVENPFTDIPEDQWYFQSVLWAVEKGITSGTSATTFSPDQTCTRAQVVTFLWRAFGNPEPTRTENPFTDVAEGAYYYDAVLWAVEKGITSGATATTFAPDKPCTRDQVVTFLWRAMDKPVAEKQDNPFVDVPADAYYYQSVLWAVENGITSGVCATSFAPSNPCTRAQVVTFLYRAMKDR